MFFSSQADGGSSFSAAFSVEFITARPSRTFGLFKPARQNRLQFTSVLEAKLKILEAADGGVAFVFLLVLMHNLWTVV